MRRLMLAATLSLACPLSWAQQQECRYKIPLQRGEDAFRHLCIPPISFGLGGGGTLAAAPSVPEVNAAPVAAKAGAESPQGKVPQESTRDPLTEAREALKRAKGRVERFLGPKRWDTDTYADIKEVILTDTGKPGDLPLAAEAIDRFQRSHPEHAAQCARLQDFVERARQEFFDLNNLSQYKLEDAQRYIDEALSGLGALSAAPQGEAARLQAIQARLEAAAAGVSSLQSPEPETMNATKTAVGQDCAAANATLSELNALRALDRARLLAGRACLEFGSVKGQITAHFPIQELDKTLQSIESDLRAAALEVSKLH